MQLIGEPPIVAFTGSGISAESGIPVFRGNEGLCQGYRPEYLATQAAYSENPERVWEWYHGGRNIVLKAKPNATHEALADMERSGLLDAIITQNVDGLHQRAGAKRVIELHGNLNRARCIRCRLRF